MLYNRNNITPVVKSSGEELMAAQVLRGVSPVQHRHLPDPATKYIPFWEGSYWMATKFLQLNNWLMEVSWFPDAQWDVSTQIRR